MTSLLNLQKRRNGVYYLRLYVPTDLLVRFGRSEFTRSIRTKRKGEAERAIPFLKNGWSRLITMAKQTPSLGPDDLKEMAKRYFDRALAKAEQERTSRRAPSSERQKLIDGYAEMVGMLQRWLKADEVGHGPKYGDDVLKQEGITISPDSKEYKTLSEFAMKAQVEINQIMHDRELGASPINSIERGFPAPHSSVESSSLHHPPRTPLRVLTEEFLKEHNGIWRPKTASKYHANLSVCMALLGPEVPASRFEKAQIRELKDSLSRLPANWTKLHKDKTVSEVLRIETDTSTPISPATVNAYLGSLSSLFAWAQKFGYVDANPVSGIRALDPVRPKDKRSPFPIEQLQTIFNAPIYTGMKSSRKWSEAGSTIIQNERYWLPLLALFTGMRLGELVAIKGSDISENDGIFSISIPISKTDAGIRTMPIHPTLIDLGFLDYISAVEPSNPIFPGASQKAYSKFFRRFQDSLGIQDPKLVFHSFRHNFSDALRAAQVQEPIAKVLLGHSDHSVTGQYGSGYPTQVLYDAIKLIDYKELDISPLLALS